jgi:hypothetical protein
VVAVAAAVMGASNGSGSIQRHLKAVAMDYGRGIRQ